MNNARKCPQCQQHLAIDSFQMRGNTGFRFKKCIDCMQASMKYVCPYKNCNFACNNIKQADYHIETEMYMENIMAGRPSGYGLRPS